MITKSAAKDKISELIEKYERLDRKIDEEVYKLYGLTGEEIRVVEESTGR